VIRGPDVPRRVLSLYFEQWSRLWREGPGRSREDRRARPPLLAGRATSDAREVSCSAPTRSECESRSVPPSRPVRNRASSESTEKVSQKLAARTATILPIHWHPRHRSPSTWQSSRTPLRRACLPRPQESLRSGLFAGSLQDGRRTERRTMSRRADRWRRHASTAPSSLR
jgi:hypothetical protein